MAQFIARSTDEVIRDRDGNPIHRSRNLAGIRRYVATGPAIKQMAVGRIGSEGLEGKLCILFTDGSSYETNFASFGVLTGFVSRWRNAYGAPILVDGQDLGPLNSKTFA